jgi:hypothetical protein
VGAVGPRGTKSRGRGYGAIYGPGEGENLREELELIRQPREPKQTKEQSLIDEFQKGLKQLNQMSPEEFTKRREQAEL